jgi:hypothetical protein
MAASNCASCSCAGEGPSLTRPKVASCRMRRHPRSGSSAADVATGEASAQGPGGGGATEGGAGEGAACWRDGEGGAAGRGGEGEGVGGRGGEEGATRWRGGAGGAEGGRGGSGGAGGRGGAVLDEAGGEAGVLGWPGCRRSRRNSSRSFIGSSGAGGRTGTRTRPVSAQYRSRAAGRPLLALCKLSGALPRCRSNVVGHSLSKPFGDTDSSAATPYRDPCCRCDAGLPPRRRPRRTFGGGHSKLLDWADAASGRWDRRRRARIPGG